MQRIPSRAPSARPARSLALTSSDPCANQAIASCRIGRSEPLLPDDVLVLWGAGAYGTVQASNYNSRPRPAEILAEGSRMRLIRRRESRADLTRGE
jgi:hypothetical protein